MTRGLRKLISLACAVGLAGGCGSPEAPTQHAQKPPRPNETEQSPTGGEAYHGLIQYRARDSKPAITNPLMLNPQDAVIAAGTEVIGVYVGGEARAYPLYILNNHQVVNDRVGGIPLSASW
jgi:hypothetical protein